MGGDRARRRWKAATLLALGIAVGVTLTATPTTAHVTGSVPHLVTHLKQTFFTKTEARKRFVPRLFGNFNGGDGRLVRGRGVVSSSRGAVGFYIVRFNRNIQKCVLLASSSSNDSNNPASVTVGAAYYQPSTTPRDAFVLIRSDFADTRVDADFSLAALC